MKILIVDDEIITIKMIKNIIDWKNLGLEVIGHAIDGDEAYEMVLKERPDIILSDIRMTNMNGLELVQKVKNIDRDIKFILMSAYANFGYVKEAMQLGCSDYILKPIDELELEEILRKIVTEIRGTQNKNKIVDESIKHLRRFELYKFIKTGKGINKVLKNIGDFSVKFDSYYILLIQQESNSMNDYTRVSSLELIQENYISNILKECINGKFGKNFLELMYEEEDFLVIIESCQVDEVVSISKRIQGIFLAEFELEVNIYFSQLGSKLEESPSLYNEIKSLNKYGDYLNEERILGYGYNYNRRELESKIGERSVEERKKYSEAVEQSLKIIQRDYDKNISLEEITKEVAVSKNYFCYIFKKEVGVSLWSYLTQVRLEEAKKLLKETDMKTYEIAFKVGYDNPSYFSKIFKKVLGVTPNEYREKK